MSESYDYDAAVDYRGRAVRWPGFSFSFDPKTLAVQRPEMYFGVAVWIPYNNWNFGQNP